MSARATLLLAALLLCGCAAAQEPAAAGIEKRLAALETLIERSSAARGIEASGVAAAAARHAAAREALRQAQDAARTGDTERAEKLAAQARNLLVEAARLATAEQIIADKARADYDSRLQSAQALLAAQRRVSSEKGDAHRGAETTRAIESLLASAAQLRAEGRVEQARQQLDQAYLIAKASLGAMRGGETLLRSLTFATKADEYRYEVDRNDTHRMLIDVLLSDRRPAPATLDAVRLSVERARQLRMSADTAAARDDHAAAVKLLEESTGELVKAIRAAGVYIPG